MLYSPLHKSNGVKFSCVKFIEEKRGVLSNWKVKDYNFLRFLSEKNNLKFYNEGDLNVKIT